MKKNLMGFLIALTLLTNGSKFALADGVNVNLTVKNNGDIVYSGTLPLSPTPSEDNVLSIIKQADTLSSDFDISNIVHYSFGDYLKCINVSGSDLCDNWQYKVDDVSPDAGMDSKILSGGENVVLYFGDENKTPEPQTENSSTHSNSGGSGYIIPNTVFPTPSPLLVSPKPTPPSSNINLEEKPKDILPISSKKQPKKISKITLGHSPLGSRPTSDAMGKPNQNTAIITNSIPSVPVKIETKKNTWWGKFWDKIFSVF